MSRPCTKGTLVLQVIMTAAALLFIVPIFINNNYSFKGKRELYLSSPLALPESLNLENYAAALEV